MVIAAGSHMCIGNRPVKYDITRRTNISQKYCSSCREGL